MAQGKRCSWCTASVANGKISASDLVDDPCPECDEGVIITDEEPATRWLLIMENDLVPIRVGPFASVEERFEAARSHRASDPDKEDGLYRLDVMVDGTPVVNAFSGVELEDDDEEDD